MYLGLAEKICYASAAELLWLMLVIAVVLDYCCCCKASTGTCYTANTSQIQCCENLRHAVLLLLQSKYRNFLLPIHHRYSAVSIKDIQLQITYIITVRA